MAGDLDDVVRHYEDRDDEDARLRGGLKELELVRTQEILRCHLPPPPARVVDIGGGTGIHAAWLLDDGYDVHLVDVTPRHVERALASLGPRGLTAEVADARWLPSIPDASFDAVLLLGPLYHLPEPGDRLAALDEARRVARPLAPVAVAAISRFASLFDGLARGFLFDAEFRAIVERDLIGGPHTNDTGHPNWFTTAYFHHPEELGDEITAAGLTLRDLVGVEGMAGWLAHLGDRWADPDARAVIVESARLVEAEPTLLGLSAHLLAIAVR